MRKMHLIRIAALSMTSLALAGPAFAQGNLPPAATAPSPIRSAPEVVPFVNTGDQIGIACSALVKSNADSDVRVVLTISAEPGETPPGFKKVLATDEDVAHGAVRVRIPTVPDLENHTVNVNVYVMGDKGTESCDAGHMKIVRQRSPSLSGSVG
jgi:hypothetical protein